MIVTAMIDTHAAVAGTAPSQSRLLQVDAATYEQGRDQLAAMIPDGFRLLWYRVPDR